MEEFKYEFKLRGGTNTEPVYKPCKVVYSGSKYIVVVDENGREFSRKRSKMELRKIDTRTDEEKAVQDILKVISNIPTWSCKSSRLLAYIKAGKIHGLKWSVNYDN